MWKRRLFPILFGVIIVGLLTWVRLADPYPTQALRDITFDNYQRLAPRTPADFPVRIIDVDEASLTELGQWPWPRDMLAMLATRLTELGAAAVVYDMLFPEPDRTSPSRFIDTIRADIPPNVAAELEALALTDHDAIFAAALATSPSVLGFSLTATPGPLPPEAKAGFAVVGPMPPRVPTLIGATLSLPALLDAAYGHGSINVEPTGTISTVRRLPLLWSNGTSFLPALSLEALRVAIGGSTFVVFADQSGFGTVESIRLSGAGFAREVPTTPEGSLWLYYQPTPPDLYVSARDLLGDNWTDLAPLIAGNIVFIGTSAPGLVDMRGTPMGTDMPGVEIHAQAVQQILAEDYLIRADWVSGLEIVAFLIIGLTTVAVILATGPLVSLLAGGVLAAGVAAGSWFAFVNEGLLIDPSFPLLGSFLVYTAMIFFRFLITDADKRKIRSAFGNYVDPVLLAQIERNSAKLELGGETRELTIMFSDVRSFTTVSENFDPPGLVNMLNTLFGALGHRITEEYGTIDKFIGDAIMAFWNAPVDVDRHALRACRAALGMREELAKLNAADAFHLRSEGHAIDEIAIGIGISTGEALVGNLGLETRFDYSCVGDTVNVASRVEGACKTVGYDIVVVEETRAAAPEMAYLEAGSIALKGKTNRERIHILVGDEQLAESAAFHELRAAHAAAVQAFKDDADAGPLIDRCIDLITFEDRLLRTFFETMRSRHDDFCLDLEPADTELNETAMVSSGPKAPMPASTH